MSDELRRADDIQIKVLEERLSFFMENTTEYRKALCAKLDVVLKEIADIREDLARLPCDARKPAWENVTAQIRAIWIFISAIVLAIITDWVKGR